MTRIDIISELGINGEYTLRTILLIVSAIALRASRTLFAPPNSSCRGYLTSGFATNWKFINRCKESQFRIIFLTFLNSSNGISRYGRLNVTGTILSKRDILKLIGGNHVGGYDDPRLYTLVGLRRRGVPPGAILSFVNELGVTKAKTNIQVHRFEQSVRRYLETTVPRLMVVVEPLKVIIDDLPEDYLEMVELPYSKDPAFGVC